MRYVLFAAVVFCGLLLVPATGMAQKRNACPADATKASSALWPSGSVKRGQTVTGKHPCGRNLECSGGAGKSQKRTCRWR